VQPPVDPKISPRQSSNLGAYVREAERDRQDDRSGATDDVRYLVRDLSGNRVDLFPYRRDRLRDGVRDDLV
jgi:hypothetical protein